MQHKHCSSNWPAIKPNMGHICHPRTLSFALQCTRCVCVCMWHTAAGTIRVGPSHNSLHDCSSSTTDSEAHDTRLASRPSNVAIAETLFWTGRSLSQNNGQTGGGGGVPLLPDMDTWYRFTISPMAWPTKESQNMHGQANGCDAGASRTIGGIGTL